MKWIKASERLQKDDHEFVFIKGCRVDKGILRREFSELQNAWFVTLYYNGGFGTEELTSWREGHEELNKIFWLDENESESTCYHCGDVIEHPLCRSCDVALTLPTEEY